MEGINADEAYLSAWSLFGANRHSGEGRNPVKHDVRSTRHKKVLSASHDVFELDSGLRPLLSGEIWLNSPQCLIHRHLGESRDPATWKILKVTGPRLSPGWRIGNVEL